MKKIIPSIAFEDCKAALEYYREAFGGEIRNLQLADDKPMFKGHEGKIVHSELHINADCILYLYDMLETKTVGDNFSLLLELDNQDEINRLFAALSKEGEVVFELQKTFWGAYHAVVTDKFGVTWSLDYRER